MICLTSFCNAPYLSGPSPFTVLSHMAELSVSSIMTVCFDKRKPDRDPIATNLPVGCLLALQWEFIKQCWRELGADRLFHSWTRRSQNGKKQTQNGIVLTHDEHENTGTVVSVCCLPVFLLAAAIGHRCTLETGSATDINGVKKHGANGAKGCTADQSFEGTYSWSAKGYCKILSPQRLVEVLQTAGV